MKGQISLFHPDFISDRKRCSREPGYTLPSAKQLVWIQNLKSAEVRCVCTSGNPFCIFGYLKTQASKQHIWLFSGVILPKLRGTGICCLRQEGGSAQPLWFQQEPLFCIEVEKEVGKGSPPTSSSPHMLEMLLQPSLSVLRWLHETAESCLVIWAAGTQTPLRCTALAEFEWQGA